jgi:hypothetical protein
MSEAALPCVLVHLRRALLLFAIVLGLAALATSISRPEREEPRDRPVSPLEQPQASPGPAAAAIGELRLPKPGGGRSVALESGQAATLLVSVEEPGQVELPSLGLASPAEPNTPARFELLARDPATHRVRLTPAEGAEERSIGRLIVR